MKSKTIATILLLTLAVLLTVACNDAQSKPSPVTDVYNAEIELEQTIEATPTIVTRLTVTATPTVPTVVTTPVIERSEYAPYGTTTLEELMVGADFVAIASLISVTVTIRERENYHTRQPEYTPLLIFQFRIHEYLKGHSEDIVNVDVVQCCGSEFWSHDKAAAIATAHAWNNSRNAERDIRPAVVFLTKHEEGDFQRPIAFNYDHYEFTAPSGAAYAHRISIESTENKPWLPSSSPFSPPVTGDAEVTFDDSMLFLTDPPPDGATGSSDPDITVSLGSIRSKLNEFAQLIEDNANVADYEECLQMMFYWDRQKAVAEEEYGGHPFNRGPFDLSIESGRPIGTNLMEGNVWGGRPKGYPEQRFTGPDADLFENWINDPDEIPENGWQEGTSITRPLAAGEYKVFFLSRGYYWIGCDYWDEDNAVEWDITVTTTPDVIHEAFFDPGATDSGEVGYEVSEFGTLPQDTFDLPHSEVDIRVERLTWYEDAIEMEFEPHIDFSPFEMDIIELDGSRSLTLPFGSATVRGHDDSQSYSWGHCDQPWHEGDKLMIRIREAGASGDVGPSVFPKPCEGSSPSRRSGEPTDDGPTGQDGASTPEDDETASEQSPDAPRIVDIEEEGTSVMIVWEEPETGGNNIVGYRIFRAGPADMELSIIVEDTASTQTDYTDEMLNYETEYRYAVAAVYTDGTVSPMSAIVSTITNRFVAEE